MDTSNSIPQDFRAISYLLSFDEEERALGEHAKVAYEEVRKRLAPILHYVTSERITDQGCIIHRVSELCPCEDGTLVLSFHDWLLVKKNYPKTGGYIYEQVRADYWQEVPFLALLVSLRDLLKRAEEKKRQHLEAISKRREFVEGVIAEF